MRSIKNNRGLRSLDAAELQDINGGNANGASITMSSSTDSLVSLEFKWQQGDQSRDWKISAGNDVNIDINAWANALKA